MRKRKTFSVVVVTRNSSDAIIAVDVDSGIEPEELAAKLALKPSGTDFRVFAGDEIPWASRNVIEIGTPRTRKPRTKAVEAKKPRKNGSTKKVDENFFQKETE